MKDEIKDILLKLQILKNTKEIDEYHIDKEDGVRLLNYITNLQEENEDLKDYLDIFKLSNKTKQETIDDFRKRVDKAIKYINKHLYMESTCGIQHPTFDGKPSYDFDCFELENILNGGKNE